MNRKFLAGIILLPFLTVSIKSGAAPIKISSLSSLTFPQGVPGDSIFTIPAGASETAVNASFQVTGNANQSFSISLPFNSSMVYRKGSATDSIMIHSFTSYPQTTGILNNLGQAQLFVGATRDSLRMNQMAGSYSGSFSVTVVY